MNPTCKKILVLCILLLQYAFSYCQFSETIFYDTISKVSKEGYIHSGVAEGKFIYLSGSSFSEQSPLPTVTKIDTSGNVLWTAGDNDPGFFGNYYGYGNGMATCRSTFKSANRIFSIAAGSGGNQVWCMSDSSGLILWKTSINKNAVKIVDYSPAEILLITADGGFYEYNIINKISGIVTFTKLLGHTGVSLQNNPNILVDESKNILISWDDNCYKYRDKNLSQLLWTSNMPNNGTLKMIDVVLQDSGRYLLIGNNYARAVDSLTGNTVWYKPIRVGYVQGQQSGDDGNPSGTVVKDSLLYITWVSPYVGGVDLARGFTLTRLNTRTGYVGFNTAYDFNGIPPDPGPQGAGEMDWPLAISMDANNQVYLSGSYDYSSGPENPGNWGIMKINGTTGDRIYESTITEDSTQRMSLSQGRFLYYYNGKMYCAGNVNKAGSNYYARPLLLKFDTVSVYREQFRINPDFVYRYPSSLIGMTAFSNQKMALLKKLGQSSVIELRNTSNQLIWSKQFSSSGKFIVPQNIKNLADTAITASFIIYTKNTRYVASLGQPDSILFVRLDSMGAIAFQRSIKVSNTDTVVPVQIYTDKPGRTNFIYLTKGGGLKFGNGGFMLDGPATRLGAIGISDYSNFNEIPKMRITRVQHYYGDTMVFNFSNEIGLGFNNVGFRYSATQPATVDYVPKGTKLLQDFTKIYSTIKLDSNSYFVTGKSETGTIIGGRYNRLLNPAFVWSQISSYSGAMLNADTSRTSIYTLAQRTDKIVYVSKLNKVTGNLIWDAMKVPQATQVITTLDIKYNNLADNFTIAGYITDSAVAGNAWSYFYLTLDSSGNVVRNINRPGAGITETRVNVVEVLQSGNNGYGGSLGLADLGTVGFYNADCNVANVVPSVTITTSATNTCNSQPVTFTATAINGGSSPVYQWQVNGVNTGTNSNTFTSTSLNNNDQVKVILTSNANCLAIPAATSNIITMTGGTLVTPAVSTTVTPATPCSGIPLVFTAVAVNGGSASVYQWKVNGVNAGTNNVTFTSATLNENDIVTVVMTSSLSCVTTATATSAAFTVHFVAAATPSVTITASAVNICAGSSVTFTAVPVNGGTSPTYQWQVNGVNAGTNNTIFTAANLANGDQVKITMSGLTSCGAAYTISSNTITVNVQQLAVPVIISGSQVLTVTNPDAAAIYTWQVLGGNNWTNVVPAATGTTYTVANAGTYRVMATKGNCIKYSASQVASLVSSNSNVIYLRPNPAHNFIRLDSINLAKKWKVVDITDMAGRRVLPLTDIINRPTITIDISILPPGTYFAIIKQEDGVQVTKKFVKL